jgi:hypothetical protein
MGLSAFIEGKCCGSRFDDAATSQIERSMSCQVSFFPPDSFLETMRLHELNGSRGSEGLSVFGARPGDDKT